jgi:zinc protease
LLALPELMLPFESCYVARLMLRAFCRLLLVLAVMSLAFDLPAADAGLPIDGQSSIDRLSGAVDALRSAVVPRLPIRRIRLDNGLRVVLSRDISLPTVALCVTYDVGTRNEGDGQRGFAHLLELLMFEGSRNVAAGEHARWIAEHGGRHAAMTSSDRTHFIDRLPAHALALGLWLEADRMKSLELSADAFERQRRVAQLEAEGRRFAPHAPGNRKLHALVFRDFPSYALGPLEGPTGQSTPQHAELRAFHRQFYAPNNAVLTLAGNFEVLEALNLIHEYFADAQPVALPPAPGRELPEQTEPRSATLEGSSDPAAALLHGWAIPASRTADHYALELAMHILGTGATSRLQQLLVVDKSYAREIVVWTDEHRGPDLFGIEATLTDDADPEQVSRLVLAQIAALGRFGPSAPELTRAQRQIRARFLLGLDGNRARAIALSDAELFTHDARLLETDLDRYEQVSREDVQRVVARYLRNSRRSDVLVWPRSP